MIYQIVRYFINFLFGKLMAKIRKKKLSILENLEVFQIIFLFQNIKVKE